MGVRSPSMDDKRGRLSCFVEKLWVLANRVVVLPCNIQVSNERPVDRNVQAFAP